ncbi:MAG: TIGR01620 family protein [Pseudomonadota bacterium]
MSDTPRGPQVFDVPPAPDDGPEPQSQAEPQKPKGRRRGPRVFEAPPQDMPPPDAAEVIERLADRTGQTTPWGRIALGAFGTLLSFAIGLWAWSLIDGLFARVPWLGWIGIALTTTLLVAIVAIAIREVAAMRRLANIERLRNRIESQWQTVGVAEARGLVTEVSGLYATRPDLAAARAALSSHRGEIIDGPDLLALAERDLMLPLDDKATALIANAARRVSVVSAVSPRALFDVAYVLFELIRLIGRIAAVYGARPGRLSFLGLARKTVEHLAVTGALALGDGIIEQALGHGLTARLSARLGEGVLNGFLTARVGVAAMSVCRPMPFSDETRPRVTDIAGDLVSLGGKPAGNKTRGKPSD